MSEIPERLKRIELALAKVAVLDDDDLEVLADLAKRERDRRVVDAWLADLAGRFLSRGKYVVAIVGVFYLFLDHIVAFAEFIFEYWRR